MRSRWYKTVNNAYLSANIVKALFYSRTFIIFPLITEVILVNAENSASTGKHKENKTT